MGEKILPGDDEDTSGNPIPGIRGAGGGFLSGERSSGDSGSDALLGRSILAAWTCWACMANLWAAWSCMSRPTSKVFSSLMMGLPPRAAKVLQATAI